MDSTFASTVASLALASLAWGGCVAGDSLADNSGESGALSTLGPSSPARLTVSLSDPQLVQAIASFNVAEVQVAEAALPDLARADVEAFSQRMVDDHRGTNYDLDRLRDKVPLTAQWSELSQTIERNTEDTVAALAAAGDVDQRYVDSEIAAHTQALAIVDCVMIAEAQDASFLRFLSNTVRPRVASHLQQARWFIASAPAEVERVRCEHLCLPHANGGPLLDPVRKVVCTH